MVAEHRGRNRRTLDRFVTKAPLDRRLPVLVGVGQVLVEGNDAPEPVELLARAAEAAIDDAQVPAIRGSIQAIEVVRIISWRYRDAGALLARRIGAHQLRTTTTANGGQMPQALVNRAAERILRGELDVVLIGGAESYRTRRAYRARGELPPWTPDPDDAAPTETFGSPLEMTSELEQHMGIRDPIQAYPLFEDAVRRHLGRSESEHRRRVAELWSRFSEVAVTNPYAALPRHYRADAIATPSTTNRMVGFPYTKLLNSNASTNQAAALLLCSAGTAHDLGVSRDRWVYFHGGAEANEVPFMSNRRHLYESVAIRAAGDALLSALGISSDDLDHVDLYSCFPSAVEVSAEALGIGLDRQLSVTGGLTFAGGPWNNYVTHSLATMAGVLREAPGTRGLCTANGGVLSKHAMGVYSTSPPARPVVVHRPQSAIDLVPRRAVVLGDHRMATVEAATVLHDADGHPERAFIACLVDGGARTWATSTDHDILQSLVSEDHPPATIAIGPDSLARG
jgi:acetyl-CoA C-acetyltransferase